MTNVCIIGGGFAGLSTALLLAADGHDVSVVERDAGPPSRDPEPCRHRYTCRHHRARRNLAVFTTDQPVVDLR
jgi:2-polyprenyl-6-methoxyphenol hydroxylase-like FAD-dependent oxidoreductase